MEKTWSATRCRGKAVYEETEGGCKRRKNLKMWKVPGGPVSRVLSAIYPMDYFSKVKKEF